MAVAASSSSNDNPEDNSMFIPTEYKDEMICRRFNELLVLISHHENVLERSQDPTEKEIVRNILIQYMQEIKQVSNIVESLLRAKGMWDDSKE